MTRLSRNEFPTTASRDARGTRRVLIVGFSIIVAMVMVLTMIVRPAYAVGGQTSSESDGGQQTANALVPAQIDGGSATVLVYLNGSDLESEAGEATSDIAEMLESGIGANANVVIETLGTKEWQNYGIASDHTQRYLVNQGKLELVDDSLAQLDTTDPDTLADFISWGVQNYPADRYILLFWDHGAGPVYGFGYDEFQSEESALTLDEMKQALDANSDVHFDIIGMDCCIMGSLETCLALQPYCDYMIVSEDFEPGIGWSYEGWMSTLEQNPSVDTVELGKAIVDDMVADVAKDEENGDATLALIDESKVDDLYAAWVSFAYASEEELLGTNYSQEIEWRDRPADSMYGEMRTPGHGDSHMSHGPSDDADELGGWMSYGSESEYGYSGSYMSEDDWASLWEEWDFDGSYVTMTDYFVTDIMEVASSVESDEATALKSAFEDAMVHFNSTSGEQGMSGLGVTLPYADGEFYDQMVKVFEACDIDGDYIDWLEAFVDVESAANYDNSSDYGSDLGYDDLGYDDDLESAYGLDNGHGPGSSHGLGYGHGSESPFGGYHDSDDYGYGFETPNGGDYYGFDYNDNVLDGLYGDDYSDFDDMSFYSVAA